MAPSRGPTWAKAPEFTDQPQVRATLRERTDADRRDYLEGGLRPVDCLACGTCVLVKKNSPRHTSVQWTTNAVDSCPEFAKRTPDGGSSAHVDTCPELQASIDAAVRDARLEVPDNG